VLRTKFERLSAQPCLLAEDAIQFSVQDTPILQALGLYREQAYEANDGH
jgi:gentisate 1,2-dioxygenase